MPNGHDIPEADWARLQNDLARLDGILESYAQRHGLALERNHRGVPNRRLLWKTKVNCLIEVFAEAHGLDGERWTFWYRGYTGAGARRRIAREVPLRNVDIGEIEQKLPQLLESARNELDNLPSGELK